MKRKRDGLSRQYQAALRKHLKQGPQSSLQPAQGLGRRALIIGLETLDLARIHEQALITLVLRSYSPSTRDAMIRRAGAFFAEAITPIEKTHRTALEANAHLSQMNDALRKRNVELAVSTRQLRQEIVQRKSAEESLKRSERHHGQLLEQSWQMQEQLRFLSRQLLSAQEEERKRISRELHDVIAQTLTSINVRLSALKKAATFNTKSLARNIARTQQLVQRSVDIVHRFARELRPAVLDDLGLIPALHTFMKSFREQTGIRVSLSAFAAVEQANDDKRTVLFRVAQEALTNVARHAQASEAEVRIQKLDGAICMKIKDNGKGFNKERLSHGKKNKRLGLLGMRERVEMVHGNFAVESAPGKGTTIQAQIPLANGAHGAANSPIASGNAKV
jgi:signal transduction histidine kinase